MSTLAGYTYDADLDRSPVSTDELALLLDTLAWSDADAAALARAGELLAPQVESVLDVWYGFVGSHPHLVVSFSGEDGRPDGDYLSAVRVRFGQWIRDLCARPWDQRWLDYQNEIARRHVVTMGQTDGVASDQTHIPLRYLIAFVWPITATVRSFLSSGAVDDTELDAMHAAWFKAVTLTVALWAQPYRPDRW
ncbi:protoglobin domain-containing protein [Microbacterium sp.]|uniref:protoglobin domain-containing protein n=1 Tax=Microbacterium sp. TaxID=51671 RepID=UPI003A8B58DC